jgi:hypothetical protein
MTKEQVNEKFKDTKVSFLNYHKYTFIFVGESEDGHQVTCHYGGIPEDIYRLEVSTNAEPFGMCDNWDRVLVNDSEGKDVFESCPDY